MPTVPLRNQTLTGAATDDDESQSGLESQSGIFTTDGQSTVNFRGGAAAAGFGGNNGLLLGGNHPTTVVRASYANTTLDESLVSGIDDASFLLNESSLLYHRGGVVNKVLLQNEEKLVRDEYSLDDSSLDIGDYIGMSQDIVQTANGGVAVAAADVNKSTDAMAPTTNPAFVGVTSNNDDSIFSGAYNRVVRTFLFQGGGAKKNKASAVKAASASATTSDDDNEEGGGGKTTPKTLSPKDSHEMQVFQDDVEFDDDTMTSVGRPKTISILGKAPQTPDIQTRLDDYNKKYVNDTPRTVTSTVMTVASDTKILGLRLSRVVCIVLFILVAAVAVAVGSALASQKKDSASETTDRSSNIGLGQQAFPTNSPVQGSLKATAAPTVFVNVIEDDNGGNDGGQVNAPIVNTSAPSVGPVLSTLEPMGALTNATSGPSAATVTTAPSPSVVNSTSVPTVGQVPNATEFPVLTCGGDDDERQFMLFDQARTCPWFRQTNPTFQTFFCSPQYDSFWVCRETCQNCLAAPTRSPTTEPSLAPTAPTNAPTGAPSVRSIEQVVLAAAPNTTAVAWEEQNSPQSQALEWLMEEEATVSTWPDWRIQQIYAAATLAYATNLGGGGGNRRWLNAYEECNFIGVTCDPTSGVILEIDVSARDRGGQLPDEVAMFTFLTSFNGRRNRYTGPIPAAFGSLAFLETLNLDQNSLTGNLPESFVNLGDSLRFLTLDRNDLSGEFPNNILSQMTALQVLSAFDNDLTGVIDDSVCVLPSLQSLITDCEIEGCYTQCID